MLNPGPAQDDAETRKLMKGKRTSLAMQASGREGLGGV